MLLKKKNIIYNKMESKTKYLEISSNFRNRKLYPSQTNFVADLSTYNYSTNKKNPIIDSLPVMNFHGFEDISAVFFSGGSNFEPLLNVNSSGNNGYYNRCRIKSAISPTISESSTIHSYDSFNKKCVLTSGINIHNSTNYFEYKIANNSDNNQQSIFIPNGDDNNIYNDMYLENVSLPGNISDINQRMKKIVGYDSTNKLLKIESSYPAGWIKNSAYRFRKTLPLQLGIGVENGINVNYTSGIKVSTNSAATSLSLLNNGTGYALGSYDCIGNGNDLKITVTGVENGAITDFNIISPGQNFNINDQVIVDGGDNNCILKIDKLSTCLCIKNATSGNIIGSVGNYVGKYIYINNQNEDMTSTESYHYNVPKKIDTENSYGIYLISEQFISTDETWVTILNGVLPDLNSSWEIHEANRDGVYNLIANNLYKKETCYDISLCKLIIPNKKLKKGGYPKNYSYFYVELRNSSYSNKNIFVSNNPNSSSALFKTSVCDIKGHDVLFLKLNTDSYEQTIRFNLNDSLLIRIFHDDGDELLYEDSDNMLPYEVNPNLQINLLFHLRKKL